MKAALKAITQKRLILVTGKGGVGKTTFTASIALALASRGQRVLAGEVGSDDETSSPLFRLFGKEHGTVDPKQVAPNLEGVILQPSQGHHAFLRDALPMKMIADAAMKSAAIRRFLSAAPTFPEMGILYRTLELLRMKDGKRQRYDTIVLDLPATGHALALAQIPASILKIIQKGPIADAVREGLAVLTDADQTGGVIVTLPEVLPVSEALELAEGVRKHNIPIAGIVLNRVPEDPFTEREHAVLKPYARERAMESTMFLLDRIDRAQASRRRLIEHSPAPCLEITELAERGRELASRLGAGLAEELGAA